LTTAPADAPAARVRVAVTAMFAITGVLCGTFTARFPALVDHFGISPADLSAVLFVWALCAAAATLVIRRTITRFGSAMVLRFAAPTCALTLAAVAATSSFSALLAAIAVFGAAFGVLEIALNSQGAALERIHHRPLLGSMHAAWGIGAVAGGALAAGTSHVGVGYPWSIGPVAVCALPAAVLLGRGLRGPGPPRPAGHPTRQRRRPTPAVYLLSFAAFAAFMVESSIADWSGMLLRHELGTSHAIASLGYPLFQCGLLSGRLITDRIRAAHGSRRVLAGGGLATAATFAVVASVSSPAVALPALYAVGAAIGPVLPTAFSAAGTLHERADGSAIAQVGAAGYTGLLVGPVAVGAFTSVSTLRGGLGTLIVVFGVVIAAVAAALPTPATARSAAPESRRMSEDPV
jgi:fucose permease